MKNSKSNGRPLPTISTGRSFRLGAETLVDLPVPMDMGAGSELGSPRVRFLVSRRGAEPVDVTAQVLPTVLKIVEIVFLVNGDTAELEQLALVGTTDEFQVLQTEFGVRCQYEDGTPNQEVCYPVVKPHLRA